MPIISAEPVKKLVYKIAISNHHGMIENIQISADRLYSISFIKDGNIVSLAGKIVDIVQTENCINSGYIVFDYSDDLSNKKEIIQFYRIESIKDITPQKVEVSDTPSGSGVVDVQISGESIVQDGVGIIPLCDYNRHGVVNIGNGYNGITIKNGVIYPTIATTGYIDARGAGMKCYLTPTNLDYAVKAAMCDGKAPTWTIDEQSAAQERIGSCMRTIANVTTSENVYQCVISTDTNGNAISLREVIIHASLIKTVTNCYTRIKISDGVTSYLLSMGRFIGSEKVLYNIHLSNDGMIIWSAYNSENRQELGVIENSGISRISEVTVLVNGSSSAIMETGSTICVMGR